MTAKRPDDLTKIAVLAMRPTLPQTVHRYKSAS